jgi:hypothetical protein
VGVGGAGRHAGLAGDGAHRRAVKTVPRDERTQRAAHRGGAVHRRNRHAPPPRARRSLSRSRVRRPPTTRRSPCPGQPAHDRLAHRRPAVDEPRAVELAALRGRVGGRPQLRQRAVGRGHPAAAGEEEEEPLARAPASLLHADRLQLGVRQSRMRDQAGRARAGVLQLALKPRPKWKFASLAWP